MRLRVVLLILLLPLCTSAAPDTTLTPEQIIEQTMLSIVAIRADTPAGVSASSPTARLTNVGPLGLTAQAKNFDVRGPKDVFFSITGAQITTDKEALSSL